jgi:hypothetical protein
MGVKQKLSQSTPTTTNAVLQLDKDREREKKRRAAESNIGKEFQTVSLGNEKFFFVINEIQCDRLTSILWILLHYGNMLEYIK